MVSFEIKQDFMLDGKPFKILSGAVHYFRIVPSQWYSTLYNLKALGFNTVETYIPWNLHEPQEGQFNFNGMTDLEGFLQVAQKLGLYVILRPSPFICAEWELGGLPAWLLNLPQIQLRSSQPLFLEKVQHYYDALLPRLVDYQISHGGPVLMMQVENEYGSFGEDRDYLMALVKMLRTGGIEVPLFTADGTWIEALTAGNLTDQDILVTGNFGSQSDQNFDNLAQFMKQKGKQWPLMCMEYWDGWFNRWGEAVIRREATEMVADIKQLLQRGSLNLYMFRGGTNFGFMNGCSARKTKDLPQVTSYDYDAILTEWGAPTEKYYALQKMIHELFPELKQLPPMLPELSAVASVKPDGVAGLFDQAGHLSASNSLYPQSFEQLQHYYGYVWYHTTTKNFHHPEQLKVIDAHDRVQFYVDQQWLGTQYGEEIGDELTYDATTEEVQLDLLVENMGRVNYGYKLNAPSQRKGIKGGVMVDHQFQVGWTQYPLAIDQRVLAQIDFQLPKKQQPVQPTFTHFTVDLTAIKSTFINCQAYGKGCIWVNGFNLGRYWSRGPIHSLYVPAELLKEHNEIVVFETENVLVDELSFTDQPVIEKI